MASKTVDICEKNIVPFIESMGYEVLEVEYAKKQDGMNLSFYIDSPNGIFIEDCEKVHKAIDPMLDELNISNDQPYILNVCSPGIDRPITNYKRFLKNKGKMVEVSLFSKINGVKKLEGLLVDYTDDNITLDIAGQLLVIEKNKIGQIVPKITF